MPSMRKLEPEEVQRLQPGGDGLRAELARQYDAYLADFMPGDYGEALLDEDENKLTVRNRLKAAAWRSGWALEFPRTQGPLIRFKVVQGDADTADDKYTAEPEDDELEYAA